MRRLLAYRWRALPPLVLACASAGAAGLQVAPTTLTLRPDQAGDGLWLSNTGTAMLRAQVRVYAWTQEGREDRLIPSRALAISPPMLKIDAGARQLVRVIRAATATGDAEASYRLVVDELPVDAPAAAADQTPAAGAGNSLKFVLRYSVPIFVAANVAAVPDLHGHLVREGDRVQLELHNAGGMHAQIAGIALVDAQGRREELVPGLLGYVLAGSTMRWPLTLSSTLLARGGTLQSRINGDAAEHILASIERIP